jgi:hypothetical protein
MNCEKLIELYGRRLTSSAKLLGFITILIFGVSLAFNGKHGDETHESDTDVEHLLQDQTNLK